MSEPRGSGAAASTASLQKPGSALGWGVPASVSRLTEDEDIVPTDQLERLASALAGRYTVERELGRGGMATVWLADDLKHCRKVAIKVLRPELGSLLGPERFTREIRMAAGLTHPHILPLHDSGEADGLLFYVMPYVSGESLRQKLSREKQLSIDETIAIVRQIASALDHAHAHGLVHRDVKPENILLHEGEAMVTDFGIALAAGAAPGERLTATGLMVGTPEYMSPEQAAGERTLDPRSDVYSLGCVLYEMLAGEPPYTGPTAQSVIAKRFTDPVPAIRRLRPMVPPAVEQAIMKALAKVPADRFASAAALIDALTMPAGGQPRSPSVAVLPFLNLSADPENEFFADGITEDVIAQLSKIRSLKVISRTSVMPFKKREQSLREIGARLDVATLLEGSVRRAGGRVRIVAQLIDAETDRHLWAETYDRDLTDIFAIQTDVALHIAAALEAELSSEEKGRIRKKPTDDVQAYQLYLLGKHCVTRWTQEGLDQGIKHLEQAVARDPNYALAYATIAYAYMDMGLGMAGALAPEEAFQRAKTAVARALEIDSGLAETHAVLGHLRFVCDYDWAGAEAEFKRAIELNPNSGEAYDFYGLMLSALERYDEALQMQRRAYELDPLAHRIDIVTTLLRAGRYDEALRAVTRVLEVEPHLALAHATLGWVYLQKGMPDQGITALEKAVSLSPESTLYLAQLGQALALVGRTEQAREVLRRLDELSSQRYVSPYHMAYVYTGLGEHDRAMDWLERAYEERAGGVFGIKGSFLFIPLRGHPRFKALLRKMNLA
jgi:eukaryotic-like serine/threonine-protein kinase